MSTSASPDPSSEVAADVDGGPVRLAPIALLGAVAVLALAEVLLAAGAPMAAAVVDGAALLVLVNAGAWHRTDPASHTIIALQSLGLVALARVLAFALPMRGVDSGATLLVLAGLVGWAAVRAAPALGVPRRRLATLGPLVFDLVATVGGLVLGLLVARIHGAPDLLDRTPGGALVGVAAVVAAAAAEEILFRGVVQRTLGRVLGVPSVLVVAGLGAVFYVGFHVVPLTLAMVAAGLVFGWSAWHAGGPGPAVLGHVVLIWSAQIVWPALLPVDDRARTTAATTAVLAVLVVVLAVVVLRVSPRSDGRELAVELAELDPDQSPGAPDADHGDGGAQNLGEQPAQPGAAEAQPG